MSIYLQGENAPRPETGRARQRVWTAEDGRESELSPSRAPLAGPRRHSVGQRSTGRCDLGLGGRDPGDERGVQGVGGQGVVVAPRLRPLPGRRGVVAGGIAAGPVGAVAGHGATSSTVTSGK
jgi:hypothetical protein